ncbi:hypothetical protein PENSPDRAFT_748958 [Peniophora sp. CONT]|nr:hypothetical protein PENSPDRAFT_748958 [Peniophora sp. CONT]
MSSAPKYSRTALAFANADPQLLDFDQRLREGPSATIEHFRSLFQNRGPAPMSARGELMTAIYVISFRFSFRDGDDWQWPPRLEELWDINRNVETVKALGEELWRACIGSELPMLLIDIIASKDFFEQPPAWATAVLDCLYGFIEVLIYDVEPKASIPRGGPGSDPLPRAFVTKFLKKTKLMWHAIWDHRVDVLSAAADADRRLRTIEKLAHFIERSYRYKYEMHGDLVGTKIAYIALFSWTAQSRNSLTHFGEGTGLSAFLSFVDETRGAMGTDTVQVTMPEVINAIGLEKILTTVRVSIEGPVHGQMKDESLRRVLQTADAIIRTNMDTRKTFWNFTLAPSVMKALRRQSKEGTSIIQDWKTNIRIVNCCMGLIHTAIVGLFVGKTEMPPGEDIFFLQERAVQCAIVGMQALGSVYDTVNGDMVVFNELFEPFLREWCTAHMRMITDQRFLQSYKDIARERWYENMRSIRGARYTQITRASYVMLVECWERLGKTLELDEVKARTRFETRHARMCSWAPCPSHTKPSDKPLQVCKGCKETRYCSRDCQVNDWKEGGHRVMCRRIKQ